MDECPQQVPVAIVGVSAMIPGSTDAEGFWRTVVEGRDLITDVPATHWLVEDYYDPDPAAPDKTYGRRGAFLDPVAFDPMAFGIPPNTMPATDTTQLLALMVAGQVLADATGGRLSELDRDRVSVILGTAPLDLLTQMSNRLQRPVWLKSLRESGVEEQQAQQICDRIADHYVPWQEASFPGLLSNVVAGRIANKFDLHGTNHTTDAACASSLAAIAGAVNELSLGQADLVLTGGVDTLNDILMYMCFSKTPALSPSGDCRPFSDAADGTILGEGLVMFALKRLADAERDADHIYAVIRGIGTSSDGRSTAIYAPLPEGQARALRRAYASAGYPPETVGLIEAHGTGTTAGDLAEFTALREVFGGAGGPRCALGSIKSQIGHTKSAAGAAGLLKAALALNHKVLPPTIKVDRPSPSLDLDSGPLYVNTEARPWIHHADHPRRAGVSSFGFGGSNYHLTLEEYRPQPASGGRPAPRLRAQPTELVLLGADGPAALLDRLATLATDDAPLAGLAYRSQSAFDPAQAARLAMVASDTGQLRERIEQAAELLRRAPQQPFSTPTGTHYRVGAPISGELAFVFSGQGSQYVGMGADLAMNLPAARAQWDGTADAGQGDLRLSDVVFPVPVFDDADRAGQESRLARTEWAQPALAAQSLAQLAVLDAVGLRPDCLAGHSFGELVALHAAGGYGREDLLRLAVRRGELMRDAAAVPGAMLAVSACRTEVEAFLSTVDIDGVWLANDNGPRQVVLSGAVTAIDAVADRLAAEGLATTRLNAATAFHSPFVSDATRPLREFLAGIDVRPPRVAVFGNADAGRYPERADAIRDRIADHLAQPVRFVEQIQAMYAGGVRAFVEVGAGSILTALVGETLADHEHLAVSLDRRGSHGLTSLYGALGQLAVAGLPIDFAGLWAGYAIPPAGPAATAGRLATPISGTNYGRPYPPAGGAADLPSPNPPAVAVPAAAPSPAVPATPPVPPVPAVPVRVTPSDGESPVSTVEPAMPAVEGRTAAGEWLRTVEEVQRQTAEAHAAYQRAMADSHLAYLRTVEVSLTGVVPPATPAAAPPAAQVPAAVAQPAPRPQAPPAVHLPAPATPPAAMAATAPTAIPPVAIAPALIAPAAGAPDLAGLVLEVVAEKTGYPVEMLEPGMDLEADLGIDSIKRVEILSTVRSRVPDLPQTSAAELVKLRTLGAITDALTADTTMAAAPTTAAPGPVLPDLAGLVLEVVAEKTGYPVEMLEPGMDLEADLGIDSIKRVEILSTVRSRVPDLPQTSAAELVKLRTLGAITDALTADTTVTVAPTAAVPGPVVPEAAGEMVTALCRLAVQALPAAPTGLALAGLYDGEIAVTDDGAGLGGLVADRLAAHGIRAAAVAEPPAEAAGVVFLGGLRQAADIDGAVDVNRAAFRAARAVAGRLESAGGVFVTVQDTGGDFGLSGTAGHRGWLGGVAGLARTAAQEWPAASVKAIDCARAGRTPEQVADAVVAELLTGGPARNVGLCADGSRIVLADTDTPAVADEPIAADGTAARPAVGADSVIVASGGARGVTAAALVALARRHGPRIALLGRTALTEEPAHLRDAADEPTLKRRIIEAERGRTGSAPSPAQVGSTVAAVLACREVRATLADLHAAGTQARYISVDVRDRAALAEALAGIRGDWGPITGLVHAAGVLADKRIADKTDEQFDRVFDTKVDGLRALLEQTASDPLRMLCLFSSVAARYGNVGQSDYAMANEILNQVASAEAARRPGCLVRSIGWGAWAGGMVTPALARHFRDRGVDLIDLAAGADAFVAELEGPPAPDRVVVLPAGGGPLVPDRAGHAEVAVSARSHPYLADHDIAGMPVLPMAMAMEWFAAASRDLRPSTVDPLVLHDISVLRKVGLDHFGNGGHRLRVRGGVGPAFILELLSQPDVVHYRSSTADRPWRTVDWTAPAEHEPFGRAEVYGGVLFHGPRFQAIRAVHGVSVGGAVATVVGARELGWGGTHWHTDPGALDAGLQLALLWAERALGGPTLPMSAGECRVYRTGLADGPMRCVVRAGRLSGSQAECDVALLDADGGIRAELLDVSVVLRPE
jgi:acyl transferase domain-containing protein/NADP-dependent 3-hydroxy acid dehydrogenase YdfG